MAEENKEEVKLEEAMTPEDLTALQESEDFITNFKEEDFDDPDKTEELRKRLGQAKTTVHQKRHYRDKVTELTGKLKDAGTPPKPPKEEKPEEKKEGEDAAPAPIDPVVALTFRQDHPELTKAVAEEVLAHALAYKITPEEALKKPMVKRFIEDNKDKEDIEDASIAPENRSGQGTERKDWSTASEKEIVAERNRVLQGR